MHHQLVKKTHFETLMACKSVSTIFEKLTGQKPQRICIAPGRVNLIGEHIDYNGYSVLPCAVGRNTVVAAGVSNSSPTMSLRISSIDDAHGQPVVLPDSFDRIDKDSHHWSNYVAAAFLGLRESGILLPRGIAIVVGGDLPRACGLSSSSSLVVASAMALASLRLSRQAIPPEMMADICMKAEWHVGTAGGGMDQAAIILSKAGFANHIKFNPLRTSSVKLPPNVSFVVANSLTRSAKAETAHKNFNKRVFECKLGQQIIRQCLIRDKEFVDPLTDTYFQIQSDLLNPGLEKLLDEVKRVIPAGGVSKSTVISLVGQTVLDELLTGRWGRKVWDLNEEFFIQSRAIHVFTEADRVEKFIAAAEKSDIERMAYCINESGRSLDEDYDCSCPELRSLIRVMKDSGCMAARLVGAGFGGCAVGMVRTDQVSAVIEKIQSQFFADCENKNDVCFAFEPAEGAHLVNV
jgi:N-acetylgalactosamine kinase